MFGLHAPRTASGELKAQALANAAKFTAACSQTTAFAMTVHWHI
jgi:hypothetical protein